MQEPWRYTAAMISVRNSFAGWRRLGAIALLAALGSVPAMAQWQWIDGTGSRVFSDTPPPAGTPEKNILKRPGAARVATPAPTTVASSVAGSASLTATAKPAPKDNELETRKKQLEEAEQAKKKAELDKIAKIRADNCDRAKRAKATLDSGIRIATTNAKGEREVMDDKARADEGKRLDEVIRSDCGPMPQAAPQ